MKEGTDYLRTLLSKRHSEYALSPVWVAEQKDVEQLLGDVLQHTPTHFNAQTVRIPSDWAFIAQMPFGKVISPAGSKEKLSISDTLKVFK